MHPIPFSPPVGTLVAATSTASDTTGVTATTFAGGSNLFASDLTFLADGVRDYIATCSIGEQRNGTAGLSVFFGLVLDGAQSGGFQRADTPSGPLIYPVTLRVRIFAPAAGNHTVNWRMWVSGGTGAAFGSDSRINLTVERLP